MSHAFVSYSSKDRDFVVKLAEDLRGIGCTLWFDRWNIVGRDPFWDEIQKGIESCSHFLFVISPDSIDRHSGALTELLHAASLQPPPIIVPVMARETPYQKLPIVVSPGKYQIHDFTRQPYQDCVERVSRALKTDAHATAPIERYLREQYEAPTRVAGLPTLPKTAPKRPAGVSCSARLLRLSVTIALTAVAAAFVFLFSKGQTGLAPAATQGSDVHEIPATSMLDVKSGTGEATATAANDPVSVSDTDTHTPTPSPTLPVIILSTATSEVVFKDPPMPGCPDAPPPRLVVGQRGRVTPGPDNLVNDHPARVASGAVEVARIPAGSEFDVLDGPVCADGLVWWHVLYGGYFGWTAEGEGTTYWLEPVG